MHLANYWPWALKQIIQAGADVNCEDNDHRRPIHLAVGCRQADAVEITPSRLFGPQHQTIPIAYFRNLCIKAETLTMSPIWSLIF